MRIAIYENNLLWSVRLANGVTALGHEPEVLTTATAPSSEVQLAILNLGVESFRDPGFIQALHDAHIVTVGHAGHKESDILRAGREAQCDHVVSNSTLTHKLADILALRKLPVSADS
ncbi:MAG: hypothetical protein JNM85_00260 [Chthonomonas sp.]|nr:hypothetical protein [Chthonomonas sp.]